MKQVILFFAVLLTAQISYAQSAFKAIIQNEETKQAVSRAKISVRGTEISATTDAAGKAELTAILDGMQTIEIFAEGYEI